jgi:hypothetical protein
MARTTKDIRRSINTAERALALGNNETARRAVSYALSATGLRARLSSPVNEDPAILTAALDCLKLWAEAREAERQAARSLFAR